MKTFPRLCALLLAFCGGKAASAAGLSSQVETAFSKIRVLKDMNPGQEYTLTVHGKPERGTKENFLRRRESAEILKSGLSCGCGDYAISFLRLTQAQGVQTRLIDGAEVSTASLANHFSGHAVVAVREVSQQDWWLVNPTDQTILSKHWSPTSRSFEAFGRVFWIGYNGPLAGYPVHNSSDLQRFYTSTLQKVPSAFLNRHLRRLNFSVAASLRDGQGRYRNPRVANLLALQPAIFKAYHVLPVGAVTIELVRGKNDAESRIEHLPSGLCRGSIGLESACSPSLLDYFEQSVNHH